MPKKIAESTGGSYHTEHVHLEEICNRTHFLLYLRHSLQPGESAYEFHAVNFTIIIGGSYLQI